MAQYYLTTSNDNITGTNQADIFTGGDPDFEPTGGTDKLQGGGGNDQFHLAHVKTAGTIDGGTGIDTVYMDRTGSLGTIKFSNVETLYIALLTSRGSESPGQVDATLEQLAAFSKIKLNPTFTMGVNFNILGAGGEFDFSIKTDSDFKIAVYGSKTTSGLKITGSKGDDRFSGSAFNDVFSGGEGNDGFGVSGGYDVLNGGIGNDYFNISRGNAAQIIGGVGTDTVNVIGGGIVDLTAFSLSTVEILNFNSTNTQRAQIQTTIAQLSQFQRVTNEAYATQIAPVDIFLTGKGGVFDFSARSDNLSINLSDGGVTSGYQLTGTKNADILSGSGFGDTLNGGGGNDKLVGGGGNDIYITDGGDTIIEKPYGGIDTVISSTSFKLGDNLNDLKLSGKAAINGTGNSIGNTITGNDAANILDGAGGPDTLIGGTGNDTYITDGGDKIIEKSNGGLDTVISSVSYKLGDNLNDLKLSGNAAINGTGNSIGNTITGNDAANILDGAGGPDTLIGGAGNDTYITDGGDKIIEQAGQGTDTVKSSVSYTLGSNLENLTLIGSGSIGGTGNSLANKITGNTAANSLNGGAGNDRLAGGLGNDVLMGGLGNDSFVFDMALNAKSNRDVITDFTNKTGNDDIFNLDNLVFTKLGAAGAMNAAFFKLASEKQDANDYIIYDKVTGILSYDADGSGSGKGIQFAQIASPLALTAHDFLII